MRPQMAGTSGMTLIEIMIVITIIGMVGGLVGVSVMNQLDEARTKDAKIQMQSFSQALELYRLDFGSYPSTSEGLESLVSPPKNKRSYMQKIPKDPWSNDFIYIHPGSHNTNSFDIMSYGSDGAEGGEDDIGNWDEDE